jgi:hypothetical protein
MMKMIAGNFVVGSLWGMGTGENISGSLGSVLGASTWRNRTMDFAVILKLTNPAPHGWTRHYVSRLSFYRFGNWAHFRAGLFAMCKQHRRRNVFALVAKCPRPRLRFWHRHNVWV